MPQRIGAAFWWVTPFTPLQSAAISFIICILGFAGGLVMNAIKRDIGIKDFGVVIEGDVGFWTASILSASPRQFSFIWCGFISLTEKEEAQYAAPLVRLNVIDC